MADQFISMRNLKFLLYEVFDVPSLTKHPYFSVHNKKTFDMVLDASHKLANKLLRPIFSEMDRHPPEYVNQTVKVHPDVRKIMTEFGEGGWISASFPEKDGGEQLPFSVCNAAFMVFSAANYSASVFPGLSAGAARLITSFGTRELIDAYVPNMLAGKWQGTMALTEPEAGSSLTDITTTASPTDFDYYKIKGHKIFISAGDHDGTDNVVHLMLAKIDGAPPGVKGISLFVVPKLRPEGNGGFVDNDVAVSQIFHKMGYRGTPITELSIGDNDNCHGFLLGEPHKGLSYMFQMMNEERVGVGLGAASIASAAYYASLDYARTRPQGRKITSKDPTTPQMTIIGHADIKRMLLFQKSMVEGAFSLLMQCSFYEDLLHTTQDQEEKENFRLLLEILTPIAKTYPSEMGILSTSAAIQIFGGYGYCDDFPVEQHFRDTRIHPIHEGTTGIQGMDLLGRKVVMKQGKAALLFLKQVRKAIDEAKGHTETAILAEKLEKASKKLEEVTMHLGGIAMESGPEAYLADATLYLEFFSLVAIGWQWLIQAMTAQKELEKKPSAKDKNFYTGKLFAARYFFGYELPKILGLVDRLITKDPITIEMQETFFSD